MASDIILEIDGIEGESKTKAGCIDVMSYSWGLANHGSASQGGGLGGGKSSFSDFNFLTNISKASPALATKCSTGVHIPKATLYQRKAGGEKQGKEFLVITLEDLLVSSYQTSSSDGAGAPADSFSFNYAKIKVEYKVQAEDGSMKAGGEFAYDVKGATAV